MSLHTMEVVSNIQEVSAEKQLTIQVNAMYIAH